MFRLRGRKTILNHCYFDPGCSISDKEYRCHRLSKEFLKNYDPLDEESARAIVDVMDNSRLIAFNADNLLEFLYWELDRHDLCLPRDLRYVSLQPAFSEEFGTNGASLSKMAQKLGMRDYDDAVTVKEQLKLDHLPGFGSAAVSAWRVAVLTSLVDIKGDEVTIRNF